MSKAEDLLDLMKIGPEDLAANREGRLGPHQRKNQGRQGFGFLATGLAIDVLFFYGGFIGGLQDDPGNVANWLIPLVLGILAGGFFTYVGIVLMRGSNKDLPVTCVTGQVSVYAQGVGPHQGMTLKMKVGDEVYGLPLSLLSKDKRYAHALTEGQYRVYVRGKIAVGIEPVE